VGLSSSSQIATQILQGSSFGASDPGILYLARGTATPSASQTIGSIRFSDNTHVPSGAISAARDGGTWSATSKPTFLTFQTTANGATSITERMKIESDGTVLVTSSSANKGIELLANGSRVARFAVLNPGVDHTPYIGSVLGNDFYFITNNTERGRFTSAGDFLVGTSSAGGVGGFTFFPTGSGGSPMLTWNKSSASSTTSALFQRNSSTVGAISYTSSAVTYATSSDYRLKENVADIDDGITRVKQLLPKRFNFIVNADKTVDGFLAHEAQAVVPEAVTGEKDGEEMQGIDQSKFVPLLTAALQEAIAKIETLETKVAALEAG